jgi:hypothetical protein
LSVAGADALAWRPPADAESEPVAGSARIADAFACAGATDDRSIAGAVLHAGSAADAVAIANPGSVDRSECDAERITERVANRPAERSTDADAIAITRSNSRAPSVAFGPRLRSGALRLAHQRCAAQDDIIEKAPVETGAFSCLSLLRD